MTRKTLRPIQETRLEITTQTSPSTTAFTSFELGSSIQRGIAFAGYDTPRPIQMEVIPAVLEGHDVLGMAQTGTGKTAAFALPVLEKLMSRRKSGPSVLVLAPTRELAKQIHEEFTTLGQFTPIRSTTVYGGVSIRHQLNALRSKPQVVVACPGRLLDLHGQRGIDLSGIDTLIIDEADMMLDMGFLPDVRRIVDLIPENRQTLMFSATMPDEIRKLANKVLNNPRVADVGHSSVVSTIDHELYPVTQRQKSPLLNYLLGDVSFGSAIIFTRTKHRALRVAQQLKSAGHNAVALQGNMSQAQRDRAMQGFREGKFQILVATDIAARGIDVANISHVINMDMPNTPDAYIHRIGRTGRSEQSGRAFTFVTPEDEAAVRALEKKLGRKIHRCTLPEFTEQTVEEAAAAQAAARKHQEAQAPTNPLEAAQHRLAKRTPSSGGGPRQPRQHRGFQQTRSKNSRIRHRKHAERSARTP
ncbi:MAG: DEAD/DEAH box helicase [Chloroflexi bacterium]|nr:DEAD/DEAH box helicase [Chloroflexota bacterium]